MLLPGTEEGISSHKAPPQEGLPASSGTVAIDIVYKALVETSLLFYVVDESCLAIISSNGLPVTLRPHRWKCSRACHTLDLTCSEIAQQEVERCIGCVACWEMRNYKSANVYGSTSTVEKVRTFQKIFVRLLNSVHFLKRGR